ncbi:hypothetical protein FXV77_14770 [Sphingobacterium phlebotomi]|uniref:HTH luxR-type domain-containing protein n=1 Tax=Sphingobacterium phlebotomi TaxID=2605433 RepID=A0A5D4H7E5_9SPHI|nr:hypothetical protein [Sphingobacterium phlebotomi]TYR34730.1 hypothetical protein FXV77_14770 [Sphingobacterium phlebotomi]
MSFFNALRAIQQSMGRLKIYFSFLLSIIIWQGFAQEETIAGLLDQAYQARLKSDYDSNVKFLKKAESLSISADDPRQRAKLLMELSKHYLVVGHYDTSKVYSDQNRRLADSVRLPINRAYAYVTQATYFNYLNAGELAVENAQKTIDVLRDHPFPALEARAYYILYGVYSGWNNLERCEKYAELAIDRAKLAEDYELLANAYSAKSVVMEFKYNQEQKTDYLDSIPKYLQQSMEVYHEHPDAVAVRTYAIANINMANHFFRYREPKKEDTRASIVHYAEEARRVYERFDRNYDVMANVNGLLAEVASIEGNGQVAESYLMNSYIHLIEAKVPSYYNLTNVTQGLSDLYARQGDSQKALYYQKKKEEFNQKIFDQARMAQANKLEAQYENKRLMAEIRDAEQRASNRRIQLYLLAGVCISLMVSLLLLRVSFKNKHKLQTERNLRLQQQKQDMEEQSKLQLQLQQQEQARLLSEQKLLGMQMEQLQKESMADALQIERKNRLLLQLKEKMKKLETEDNIGYIDRMIKEEMRLEERVEQSAREFKNIHPEFFQKLKEQSGDRLSALELKHCAYMHLKLSTKEMAAAFHIEPKSVRVSKYRIKQKLHLDKDVDLDRYLQELSEPMGNSDRTV